MAHPVFTSSRGARLIRQGRVGALVAVMCAPSTAAAQSTDAASAEALFEEARKLAAEGSDEAACAKLAESPGPGDRRPALPR